MNVANIRNIAMKYPTTYILTINKEILVYQYFILVVVLASDSWKCIMELRGTNNSEVM